MPGALTFTPLDDGTSRADLSTRQESKFLFPGADVGALRDVLLRSCRPIVYAGPVSTVYSLYFDDPWLSACAANLSGLGLRHKTRLRWYDRPEPERELFFETKWRRHGTVGKRRLQLAANRAPFGESFRTLHQALCNDVPEDRRDYLRSDTDPIVLIRYRREHFALRGTSARLTLDYDLRFFAQLGRRRLSLRFGRRRPTVALIECKTALGDTAALNRALTPLHARLTRFSKYVNACAHLGYAGAI